MAIASVSQTIASQLEWVRNDLEKLYLAADVLWSRIKTRTDVKAVSNRPSRIPFEVLSGGKFRTYNPDGGDMGQGSGVTEVFGNLSSVYFLEAFQLTALAEWSTDSDEKAIKDYLSLTQQRAAESFAGYMDAILQGSGANDLDTIVSTVTGGLVVNNADKFQDNQDIDIWSAIGGSFIATVTIASQDIQANTLWLTGAVPGGVTAGQVILISGSAGVANSGLFGLRYYQQSGNAGSYMNIQRSAFPGKYSTPNVNVNGALTPAAVRALEANIELALGSKAVDSGELVAHGNVSERAAWENNAILVQHVIMNEVRGDQSVDMLKKRAPTEIAGREFLTNVRATPGYIDFLALKHWFRIEGHPMDYYEVGGQTIFPTYGTSGGLSASSIFYLVTGCQVGNGQPRMGGFMNNIAIPKGYFGH